MGRGYASLWAEDAPLCGRIKIRCYDMGRGYASWWGEDTLLCGRILIRCYDMGEAAPLC